MYIVQLVTVSIQGTPESDPRQSQTSALSRAQVAQTRCPQAALDGQGQDMLENT